MSSRLLAILTAVAVLGILAPWTRGGSEEVSARDLARRLSAFLQDGNSYVRMRMEIKGTSDSPGSVLQLQLKQRRAETSTVLVYQILWPKERKGEAILLRQAAGRAPEGTLFVPPTTFQPLEMGKPLFGSDLSYQDAIENFYAWEGQTLVGTEAINGIECPILESKPGRADHTIYGKVRSWIDPKKIIPLRIEKYLPSGAMARRIETSRVAPDDRQRPIPANLTIRGPRKGSMTEIDGSRIKHNASFDDREFTPDGLKDTKAPRSAPD